MELIVVAITLEAEDLSLENIMFGRGEKEVVRLRSMLGRDGTGGREGMERWKGSEAEGSRQ